MPDPSNATTRVAVVGVSGYAGAELARLLLRHPGLRNTPPVFLGRMGEPASAKPVRLAEMHPQLAGLPHVDEMNVAPWQWSDLERERIGLLLLATPHEQSRTLVPEALARGMRVIDLSGAWRLHEGSHRAVYGFEDADSEIAATVQAEAVYGSPELHGPAIAKARLVANPGCYATSIILALAPILRAQLADLHCGIVCDAKSGVSGAGKNPTATTHFMYAADNLSAYAVFGHRHTGELLEQLHIKSEQIQFTPHLLPIPRGILSTVYVRLTETVTAGRIQDCFNDFYAHSPLVRVHSTPALPQIQYVVRGPFCDIGFQVSPNGRRLVIVSCLDNLLKGAASQAIENLNLMLGWPEVEGLL
ncbi:MAG: N-acetyl-gamma-glutamyl-phosphate reductase [Janthinobacterium lividum]